MKQLSFSDAEYGGKRDRGSAPYHARSGSRSVLREIVQQLEKAGLVDKVDKSGRIVSKKGRSLLDAMSTQIKKDLEREKPELKAY